MTTEKKEDKTLDILTEKLNDLCIDGPEGSFVALEMNSPDYLLSQVIHLVEQNNAHVLSLITYTEPGTGKHIVLLKVDLEDLTPILRSFERFNYTVKYCAQKQVLNDETLRNRLDELMYYLEM